MTNMAGRAPGVYLPHLHPDICVIPSVSFCSENIGGGEATVRITMRITTLLDYKHFQGRSIFFCKKQSTPIAPIVGSKQVLSISCLSSAESSQIQELTRRCV